VIFTGDTNKELSEHMNLNKYNTVLDCSKGCCSQDLVSKDVSNMFGNFIIYLCITKKLDLSLVAEILIQPLPVSGGTLVGHTPCVQFH